MKFKLLIKNKTRLDALIWMLGTYIDSKIFKTRYINSKCGRFEVGEKIKVLKLLISMNSKPQYLVLDKNDVYHMVWVGFVSKKIEKNGY